MSRKVILIIAIFSIAVLFIIFLNIFPAERPGSENVPDNNLPKSINIAEIPESADIVYHHNGHIYVMDSNGQQVSQITFKNSRSYEHVAVSFDRKYIAANEQLPNPTGAPGGNSVLWLYDIENETESRLLPGFVTAGNGGLDWDSQGFIYFAAKEEDVFNNPKTAAEHIANAAANDVYRVRFDGTGLQRLTSTPLRGESDVSVSEDGTLVAFNCQVIDPVNDYVEIWVMNSDGTDRRLVYKAGKNGVASAHDPELSPDNKMVIFSLVNLEVPPNFPHNPVANTAHDIYRINVDGTGLMRLTAPGPISIIPDWKDDMILYLDISEADRYGGISIVGTGETDQTPQRIKDEANVAKWIP